LSSCHGPADPIGQRDPSPITVVIVEDSELICAVIRQLLAADRRIEVVHNATSLAEAARYVAEHRVDVVTLDLHLPDAQGADIVERVMAAGHCGAVVVSGSIAEHRPALDRGATAAFDKSRLIADRRALIRGIHRAADHSRRLRPGPDTPSRRASGSAGRRAAVMTSLPGGRSAR
jgi:chemotaxis response regulator CheB